MVQSVNKKIETKFHTNIANLGSFGEEKCSKRSNQIIMASKKQTTEFEGYGNDIEKVHSLGHEYFASKQCLGFFV